MGKLTLKSIIFISLFANFHVNAQRTCLLHEHNPKEVEELNTLLANSNRAESRSNTYKIPVVFHIIHKGEEIGRGANISESAIFEQLEAMNNDFNAQNPEIGLVPDQFKNVVGETNFEFFLAYTNPQGEFQKGILRHEFPEIEDMDYIDNVIKQNTFWDSKKYLNVWIVDYPESSLLGYAFLPTRSVLGKFKDGVVVQRSRLGNNSVSRGRTVVHELGHYFGLLHPWGMSESCDNDDNVEDTPNCESPTYGCPQADVLSCGNTKMVNNFMDYVDDKCMYFFTEGQTAKMTQIAVELRDALLSHGEAIYPILEGCNSLDQPVVERFEGSLPSWDFTNWAESEVIGGTLSLAENTTAGLKESYIFMDCIEFAKGTKYNFSFDASTFIDDELEYKIELGFSALNNESDFFTNGLSFQEIGTVHPIYDSYSYEVEFEDDIALVPILKVTQPNSGGEVLLREVHYSKESDASGKVDTSMVTNTDNIEEESIYKIYPNPVSNKLFIDVDNNNAAIDVEIYDLTGRRLFKENLQTPSLETSNFPTGVYILKISDEKRIFTTKFIKT